jgi:hypothetical protein
MIGYNMTKESDDFEIFISRIHELLEGQDAKVVWNDKISDPDNPIQDRQIDITVRKDNFLNIIECRLHKAKQNVKWIEELIGRRASLAANNIVGVSYSGFTSGAIKKANKYGVQLYDLKELSDEDVKSWARPIRLSILFYKYENFVVDLYFDINDIEKININDLKNGFQNYYGLRSIFSAPNEFIDSKNLIDLENRANSVKFKVRFKIEDFFLCDKKVQEIEISGKASVEEIELYVPETLGYGTPSDGPIDRTAIVQKYNLGKTYIVHHDDSISISLDLSKLDVPPYWQFRLVNVTSERLVNQECFEIIEPLNIVMNVDKVNLGICGVSV